MLPVPCLDALRRYQSDDAARLYLSHLIDYINAPCAAPHYARELLELVERNRLQLAFRVGIRAIEDGLGARQAKALVREMVK